MTDEENNRKAKNEQIKTIFLTVSVEKRRLYRDEYVERMDRLKQTEASDEEIAKVAGETAINMHQMLMARTPNADITVEDCVHCLFDAIKANLAKS